MDSIPGLAQGSGVAMSCGVGRRCSSDLVLLWLWCRPAATTPIGPLAWETLYAAGAALKRKKKCFLNLQIPVKRISNDERDQLEGQG